MFEDSLVVSQVRHTSMLGRWTTLVSISFQFILAALVIALPLLHPERLAFVAATPHILIPPLPQPRTPVQHIQAASASAGITTTAAVQPIQRRLIPPLTNDDPAPVTTVSSGQEMSNGTAVNLAIGDAIHLPPVAIVPMRPAKGPMRISSGVSAGMLLSPIRPLYPEIARAAGVEGTVVVEATISRTGTIERLHVVSGPAMLQRAALDAIRTARYQPYLLNGSPTEVQTTISVNFRMRS